jgi:PAS domain S-box-containing protein
VAVAAVALGALVRWLLEPLLGEDAPLTIFSLSVMVAAYYGGLAAGLWATLLSAVSGTILFIETDGSLAPAGTSDQIRLALFGLVGAGISALSGQLRRVREQTAGSHERFSALVNASSRIFWSADANGAVVDESPSWCAFTGQTDEERRGFGWLAAVHPEDREAAAALWQQAIKTHAPLSTVFRIRSAAGEWRWTSFRAVCLLNPDGTTREWVGMNADITQRKRAEEAVAQSEARFRLLSESVPQLIWTCTAGGDCDYLNARWVDYTGLPESEQLGDRWLERLHPDDRAPTMAAWQAAVEREGPYDVEFRIRRRDGVYRWFKTRATALRDEGGNIVKWFGTCTDIDELRRAEQALAQSEERLRLAIEGAGMATWDVDLTTGKAIWSDTHFRILGYEPAPDGGATLEMWRSRVHPGDLARVDKSLDQARRERAIYCPEHRIVRAGDGRVLWLRTCGRYLYDAAGEAVRFTGIFFDNTAAHEAGEALRRFELVAQHSRDIILFMRGSDGRILEANTAAEKAYGFHRRELLALSIADLRAPGTHDSLPAQMAEADLHSLLFETVHRRKDGSTFPVEVSSQGATIGGVRTLISVIRDITERKEHENRLSQSEQRFRTAVESLPGGLAIYDRQGRYVYLNGWGLAAAQMSWDRIAGRSDDEIFPPSVTDAYVPILRRVIETAMPEKFEWQMPPELGGRITLVDYVPLVNGDGHVYQVLAVLNDITERKQAEQALRQAHLEREQYLASLEAVLDHTTEGLVVSDLTGNPFYWNPSALAAHGFKSLDECRKRVPELANIFSLCTAEKGTLPVEEWPLSRVLRGETLRGWEVHIKRRGTDWERDFEYGGTLARNREGQPLLAVITINDITARKQTERALRRSEADLRHAQAVAHTGSWRLDLRRNELRWSEEAYRIFGISPQTLLTFETFHAAVVPEDIERVSQAWYAALRGESYDVEHRITVNGREKWVRERAELEFDSAGNLLAGFGTIQDITTRKHAEEALRAADERVTRILETLSDAFVAWDREWRYTYVNAAAERLLGRKREDLLGRDARLLSGEPDSAGFDRRYLDAAARQVPLSFVEYCPPLSAWIEVRAYPSPDGLSVFLHDVTDRKLLEEQSRRGREEIETLMEVAPVAIWVAHDPNCNTITGNRMANTFYEAGEGENVSANWPPEQPQRRFFREGRELSAGELPMQEAAARGIDIRSAELDVLVPSGRWMTMFGHASPLRDAAGEVRGCIGAFLDITDRKRAEAEVRRLNVELEQRVHERTTQLEAANRELEAFAYSVSHDLRAPLRGIDGWSLALLEDYGGQLDQRGRQYLDRVRSEAQRMALLIDDLLQLSRVTRAQMLVEPVDLTSIACRVAGRLREANARRTIDFITQEGVRVEGDPRLLEIVLTNLLDNSVKFTAPRVPARIEFGRIRDNGTSAFYVRDNGVGFDMTYANTLFGAFQRLHKAVDFPGTGIGLATVQRIVHRHGGRVWAEAQPGCGATFYFTIGESK